jgi:hypothetical protein
MGHLCEISLTLQNSRSAQPWQVSKKALLLDDA